MRTSAARKPFEAVLDDGGRVLSFQHRDRRDSRERDRQTVFVAMRIMSPIASSPGWPRRVPRSAFESFVVPGSGASEVGPKRLVEVSRHVAIPLLSSVFNVSAREKYRKLRIIICSAAC